MGKKVEGWQKGEGPFSKTSDIKLTQVAPVGFGKSKDVSKVTDRNSEGPAANDGFSAPLKPERN